MEGKALVAGVLFSVPVLPNLIEALG
jgi:hypothetical protein